MSGCEVMRLQVRVLASSASSLFGVAYISGKQGRLTTDDRDFKNPRALETGARTGGLIQTDTAPPFVLFAAALVIARQCCWQRTCAASSC